VAQQANDSETVQLADQILQEEQTAAQKVGDLIEEAALTGLPQAA
jgi:ferritin-like metal-binding protein YciE